MALPKVPIDINALAKAGQIFESESSADMTVEVLIDATANRELVALSREVLQVSPGTVELNVSSFGEQMPKLETDADLTIVVAGSSPHMRRIMEIALWSSMDCVVLAEDAAALVATVAEEDALDIAATIIEVDVSKPKEVLEHDLADWCIIHLSNMRLALGAAFPFMRHPICVDLTRQTALENTVVAAVFFLPGADLPILTLNQCKLLYQIAVVNQVPLTRDRLVELAVVVASAFGLRGLTRLALKKLAPVGWLVRGSMAFGATMLMGHAAYEVYSRGGGITELVEQLQDGHEHENAGPEATTVLQEHGTA